jgi:hypothetical protein
LLKVLFEGGHFFSPGFRGKVDMSEICEHARGIFEDNYFVDCIKDGMNNKQSFVRYAYIEFSKEFVIRMHEVVGFNKPLISNHVVGLIQTYADLLGLVNVNSKNNYNVEKPFLITQEMDIIQLLNGLQEILHFTLDIKSDFGNADEMTE